MTDDSASASYGTLCRGLIEEVCAARSVSKTELASQVGVHPQTLLSLANRGLLSFELAVEVAKLADASRERLAELERAWFLERVKKDSRGATRRLFRLVVKLEEEIENLEAFLNEHNLHDQYLAQRTWNPAHGLIDKEGLV